MQLFSVCNSPFLNRSIECTNLKATEELCVYSASIESAQNVHESLEVNFVINHPAYLSSYCIEKTYNFQDICSASFLTVNFF